MPSRQNQPEKAMAPHSSTLAWKIPWMEEPGRLHAVHGVAKSRTRLSDFTLFSLSFTLFSLSCIGEGNGNLLQCSCLENPRDGASWWAAIYGVTQSRTRLSDFTFTFHFHALEKEMATHSSVLPWRIPGTGSRVGRRLWGHTESDTTEATQQQQQWMRWQTESRARSQDYIQLPFWPQPGGF